jgi:hypothetical protein
MLDPDKIYADPQPGPGCLPTRSSIGKMIEKGLETDWDPLKQKLKAV